MSYLIFTKAGFEEAEPSLLADKAGLWINENVLSDLQLSVLKDKGIDVQFLPEITKPSDEKAVVRAIEYIEHRDADVELLVEYI